MNAHIFSPTATGTTLALSACSPKSGQNTTAESFVPAADGGRGIKLLSVSYDAARDFYKEYNPLFAKEYQVKRNGETVDTQQSHDGSSKQALSVASGLTADVVTMNRAFDIELLEQKGLIRPDWAKRLPDDAVPYTNVTVSLVRKGNPKQIRGWPDLTKNGVQIVIANSKTTGNGRYAFLGAYGYGLKANSGDKNKAREFAAALLKNASVLENRGRVATTTSSQCNIGDVLIILEDEANHVGKKLTLNQFEIVYPSYTILSGSPIAAVDSVVKKKGARAAAEEYL